MFHKSWESDPVLQHCLPHKQICKNSQEKNCGIRAGGRTSLPGFAAEENILCHYNLHYFKLCKIYTTLHTHLLSSTQDKQWATSNYLHPICILTFSIKCCKYYVAVFREGKILWQIYYSKRILWNIVVFL